MTHVESRSHGVVGLQVLLQRAFASRYFMYALLVHLGVLVALGKWIVSVVVHPPEAFESIPGVFLHPPAPIPPPSATVSTKTDPIPKQTPEPALPVSPRNPDSPSSPSGFVHTGARTTNPFRVPTGLPQSWRGPLSSDRDGTDPSHGPSPAQVKRLGEIGKFIGPWFDDGVAHTRTGTTLPKCTFTCYQGKYADGDWNCNPTALENMLTQVVRWSKDRIKASVQPKAIDLASDEIYKTHPPFIFLTGHKDFRFTDKEVENLREYMLIGGAIWADNSLPGRHSRFDEAFRREMKRVFGDRDFEPVPKDHDIFNTFFHLREVPKGMNNYQETIEQIKMDGELVVIYTQNAYSDLWETALNEQNAIDTETYLDEDTGQIYTKWEPHWGSYLTGFLYRNVNEESIVQANRLALNIVVHLLTRYQDKIMMVGKM